MVGGRNARDWAKGKAQAIFLRVKDGAREKPGARGSGKWRGAIRPAKLGLVRMFVAMLLLLAAATATEGQPGSGGAPSLTPAEARGLVARALATELRTAQDAAHPMRFLLRKASPRLTTTKQIVETRDGAVARLVAMYDRPLNASQEQTEQERLEMLLNDPSRQERRKENEESDFGMVMKLLRMLPSAYQYQYAGPGQGPAGRVEKFTFRPNPGFSPPDLESEALTAMTGEIWIDAAQERVTRLEGHLQQDTEYGWGILGKLDKGGWIVIEQTDVGGRQWRIARFKMQMNLRILFKTKDIDTEEEMTQYAPVAVGMDYRQAIRLLRAGSGGVGRGAR